MKAYQFFRFLSQRSFQQFSVAQQPIIKSIDRNTLPKIVDILRIAQSHQLSIKESQFLPNELKQHFESYQDFMAWQQNIAYVLERQKGTTDIFQLDIVLYIQFLTLFSRIRKNQPLNDDIFDSLSTILKSRQRLIVLIQGIKLSVKQTKLFKIEKNQLIGYCMGQPELPYPAQNVTLFHICVKQIANFVVINNKSVRLEEATVILQALKDVDILSELIKLGPKWLKSLVNICIQSTQDSDDIRNVAVLANVFVNSGDAILFKLSQAMIESFMKSQNQKTISTQDLVTILWMLSHIEDKNDIRFLSAFQLIMNESYLLQVMRSSKVADQVIYLWSLSKISSENLQLKLQSESSIKILFQGLRGSIVNSKSIENLSQFYVASLRQGLLTENEAKTIFKNIIAISENKSKIFGVVIHDTFQNFPHLVTENATELIQKLPQVVNHLNIANFYVAFKQEESAQKILFSKTLQLLPQIHFDGMIIILDVLRSQNNPNQLMQYNLDLLKTINQKLLDPIEASSKFTGQEQDLAQLFLALRQDLNKIEHVEENKLLPIETIVKCLSYYQSKDQTKNKKNGLGNILFVCSTLKESKNQKYNEQLLSFFQWIIQYAEQFDLLELLKLYRALNELQLNSLETTNRLDDIFIKKLEENDRNGKQDSIRQRFMVSFSRHYKPQYQQLTKVYDYMNKLQS